MIHINNKKGYKACGDFTNLERTVQLEQFKKLPSEERCEACERFIAKEEG